MAYNGNWGNSSDNNIQKNQANVFQSKTSSDRSYIDSSNNSNSSLQSIHESGIVDDSAIFRKKLNSIECQMCNDINCLGNCHGKQFFYAQNKEDGISIEKTDSFMNSRATFSIKIEKICLIITALCVIIGIIPIIIAIQQAEYDWYFWNKDTIATRHSNILIAPKNDKTMGKDRLIENNGHLEFITASFDFLYNNHIEVELPKNFYSTQKSLSTSLDKATYDYNQQNKSKDMFVESEFAKISYHNKKLLDRKRKIDSNDYQNLASITTVAKFSPKTLQSSFGIDSYLEEDQENNAIHVDGKLLFGVLNGDSGEMEECLAIDERNTYLQSDNIYAKKDLNIGNHLYMKTTKSQHDVYVPVLGFTHYNENNVNSKPPSYANNINYIDRHNYDKKDNQSSNNVYNTLNFGNNHIKYINTIVQSGIINGLFTKNSKNLSKRELKNGNINTEKYTLANIHTDMNSFQSVPIVSFEPFVNLATDEQFCEKVSKSNTDKLNEKKTKNSDALKKILEIDVDEYYLPEQTAYFESSLKSRKTFMVTSKSLQNILPEAVVTKEVNIGNVQNAKEKYNFKLNENNQHEKVNFEIDTEEYKIHDYSVDIQNKVVSTVDLNVLVTNLLMAVQEQQRIIESLIANKK